jgi:hypothetical protein
MQELPQLLADVTLATRRYGLSMTELQDTLHATFNSFWILTAQVNRREEMG